MLDTIPLAAAPPPALQLHAWAALPAPIFFGKSRKGGPARQRWTPLPRRPRCTAESGPEAGRRPVRLLTRTPRDEQLETNIQRRTAQAIAAAIRSWTSAASSGIPKVLS